MNIRKEPRRFIDYDDIRRVDIFKRFEKKVTAKARIGQKVTLKNQDNPDKPMKEVKTWKIKENKGFEVKTKNDS